MRVLVTGYSPRTHASYGTIIRELWTRLMKTGEFEMEQHAWFNIPSMEDVPWKLWPTQIGQRHDGKTGFLEQDKWGSESFEAVLKKFQPEIVWNLGDIYMSRYIDAYKRRYGFKLIRWTLTEGDPIDRDNIPFIQSAERTVAITQYAADKWGEITGDKYPVIYHGTDLDVFKPVTTEQKYAIRKSVTNGAIKDDDFLIAYVGRNQGRKRPWLTFEAIHYLQTGAWGWDERGKPRRLEWDPLSRRHKDDKSIVRFAEKVPAKLWLHSADDGTRWRYDLLEKQWNVSEHVIRTDGYSDKHGLPTDQMAGIYQISDALSMMSGSEGFGVPIIEATACGVPTVYTNYSGCGEVGNVCKGLSVNYIGSEPCAISHVRWVYPDLNHGLERFSSIHSRKEFWENRKPYLRSIAEKHFGHDNIAEQWLKILREVHETPIVETVGVRL